MDGPRSQCKGEQWPEELDQRLAWSGQLAAWAPGLVRTLQEDLLNGELGGKIGGAQPQVKALTTKEKKELQGWKTHYEQDHIPFRKACITCLETMGKDRMRRRIKCAQSFCLSLDVAGPFSPGKDQLVKDPRYFLVGVVTIPVKEQVPLVESLKELGVPVVPVDDGAAGEEIGHGEAEPEDLDAEEREAGLVDMVPEDKEDLGEAEKVAMWELEQKWRQFLGDNRDAGEVQVRSLTFAVPLKSRHAGEIISATAQIYAQVRALNIPVMRIHSDRAREFASAPFRKWVAQRDLFFTMTAGDEPSRVEREIRMLKGHIRALLKSSGAPIEYWPLALRRAATQRGRTQLRAMGIQTPELLPFGGTLVAKRKTWFQRTEVWKQPMERATCWGPAADMSFTSRGYYVRNDHGKWFRTTAVVQPAEMPGTLREVQLLVEDKLKEEKEETIDGEQHRVRLHGKQPHPQAESQAEIQDIATGEIGITPHNLPRRRCHGKQAMPPKPNIEGPEQCGDAGRDRPALHAVRARGGSAWVKTQQGIRMVRVRRG